MTTARLVASSHISNHELKKLVEKMTELMKLSSVQAMNAHMNKSVYKFKPADIKVGGKEKVLVPSVASVVAERFGNLNAMGIRAAKLTLGRDYQITNNIRSLGVDMRTNKSIIEQIDVKRHFDFINGTTFNKETVDEMVNDLEVVATPYNTITVDDAIAADLKGMGLRYGGIFDASIMAALAKAIESARAKAEAEAEAKLNTGLKFRIHQVKCVDETNPEWPGSDEIAWGGAAVDDKGATSKINEHYVGGNFDDGDKKSYSPPYILKNFPLDGKNYPKNFAVTLSLAEKDSGGFADFIKKLYEAVKGEIQKVLAALGAAAGAWIGSEIGGSVGTAIGGPLGTVIGAAAGAIVGALVGWLISALNDDIFSPQETSVILPKGNCTFAGGSLVSPTMYFHYRDHGGHYQVKYDWEIVR